MDASTTSPGTLATVPAADGPANRGPIARGAQDAIREQRNAIALVLFLDVLFLVSAAVLLVQLRALDPGAACQEGYLQRGLASDGCRQLMRAWFEATDPALLLTQAIGFVVPFLAGLLLVVPVTARAAQRRPAGGARELPGRLLPMLAIALAGFTLVAILASSLRDTVLAWNAWGHGRLLELSDLGYEGPSYVARGFMALGIGALIGALLRRPAIAFGVAALLVFTLTGAGVRALQSELARANASAIVVDPDARTSPWNLAYVDTESLGQDGNEVDMDALLARVREACPGCLEGELQDRAFRAAQQVVHVALPDTWGIFFAADVALALTIGGASLLLTFPVALRRHRVR